MKKLIIALLTVFMLMGAGLFGVGLFFDQVLKKDVLQEAFIQLDMVEIVKQEVGERYEIIGELLDTEEFFDIMSTYSDGFIDYILNGNEEINISKEQIRSLFTNYSEILLKEYPELSFLPTEKFVNFLVESVDLTRMLPTYEKMMTYVPSKILNMMKLVNSPMWFASTLALFLFCMIGILALEKRKALLISGGVLLILAGTFLMIALNSHQILEKVDFKQYTLMKPAVIYMCTYFKPIAKSYLLVGLVFECLGLLLKGRYA